MRHKILITGGAGFIGSHVVRRFLKHYPEYEIINLDKLTYAGNLENLQDIADLPNYSFVKGDIGDLQFLKDLFQEHNFTGLIHLAAESHVDRSISDPLEFIRTNMMGTANLLHVSQEYRKNNSEFLRFYHISTDEVYGSLGDKGLFTEITPYDPRSPYSASKAGSDHLVRAFYHTYDFPVVLSNCSNNYGPNQFPEKLIPLVINNILLSKKIPVYGKGENIRDWIYVEDHAAAIDLIFHKGKAGETYNVGGNNEWKNLDLIKVLCEIMDQKLDRAKGTSEKLIRFVKDRAGHDLRYAIDSSKIASKLGWAPNLDFKNGLSKTVDWYLQNQNWLDHILTGEYELYYDQQYSKR
ncbi:MAG: dTDP-glucose 4,6-dehydratase [Bacteroidota bacterium]|nr:dTDP-glucose 4,6-dehydratase [Bacteroidota bacterium]